MKKIQIGNIVIGEGIPKICVPTVAKDREEIFLQIENMNLKLIDLIELRLDYLNRSRDVDYINELLLSIKDKTDKPVILTFRTAFEGGNEEISIKEYAALLCEILSCGNVDIVDVELFAGEQAVNEVINTAHKNNAKVIMSNHNFQETPDEEVILQRLEMMQKLGADIAKIALMPKSSRDVIAVLSATEKCSEKINIPIVTMSMSGTGLISRLSGEIFGSAITFGASGKVSAPGQIEVDELRKILEVIHCSL